MKPDRYEIRLSGSGGQGIIMAALLLAEGAGIHDSMHVCQTQSYGAEPRGGESQADVVISGQAIDYPKAMKLDLLLAMNQASCDTFFHDLKPEGLLIVDADLVEQVPTDRVVAIPFTRIAQKEIGSKLSANVVALGAVGHLSHAVSLKGLETAIMARAPKGTEKMNLKALRAGIRAAKKVDLSTLPGSVITEEQEV